MLNHVFFHFEPYVQFPCLLRSAFLNSLLALNFQGSRSSYISKLSVSQLDLNAPSKDNSAVLVLIFEFEAFRASFFRCLSAEARKTTALIAALTVRLLRLSSPLRSVGHAPYLTL